MTKFKCNLTLEDATDIQFTNAAGTNTGKIESDGNNLVLSNAVGDILLGDGASDIYVGDGTHPVDILFEVSGAISAESGATLTLGGEGGDLALGSALALGGNNLTGGGTITGTTLTGTSLDMNGDADISGSLNLGSYTVASQGNQSLSGKITSFQNSGSTNLYLGIKNAAYPNRGWAFNPITSGVNCNLVIKEHGSDADRIKISTGGNFEVLTGSVTATGLDINGAATIDGTTTITSSSTAALKIVGGTGVDTTGSFVLRQNGDGAGNGIAITSSNATSHRLWKDASGNFNIGSSANSNAFKQDTTGNVTIEGTIGSGAITSTGIITSTANSGDASIYINSTRPTLGFTDSNSFTDANDIYLIRGGSNILQFQWYDDSASTTTETFNITSAGNATFAGTVTWSGGGSANANTAYGWGDHGLSAQDKTDIGNLSGENTGDQTTVTGNAGTATKLAATKTIAGVAFDGSTNISLNNNAITNGAGYTTYAGPSDADEGTKGIIELASVEEATNGEDEAKAVTAAGVSAHVVSRKVHELTSPTSALVMNSQKITGVLNPTAAQDAATKAYTDAKTWNWNDITAGTPPTFNQNTTGSAGTLTTTRAIYGNNFDGSAAVTGTIATAYIADDAITEDKLANTLLAEIDANTTKNTSPSVYGEYLKLIPSDFATNGDGGNTKFGVAFDKVAGASTYGVRVADSNAELFTFVSIPEGYKATHVEIYGKRAKAVEVFEVQINASTVVSKGTGTCAIPGGSSEEFAITNVNSTATNLLAIEVVVNSNSADRLYGGRVKIATI